MWLLVGLVLPPIPRKSLFLDLFGGDIITGSSLVVRFFRGCRGSVSTIMNLTMGDRREVVNVEVKA